MRSEGTGLDAERTTIVAHGLWRLTSEGVVPVDRAWPGPLTVLAPSEKILLVLVDLPFTSRRQRQLAAPFAVEGLIAEPLDQVHVALGAETTPRRHLCAVVRHAVMRDWIGTLQDAGLERSLLVPDALALATPPAGAWRVAVEGDRALVRTDDGAGFAVELAALPATWDAGGRPGLIHEGEPLPQVMRDGVGEFGLELVDTARPALLVPPVDLRQAPYTAARSRSASPWRLVGLVAAAGVAAHLALGVVDTLALHMMAERREAETRMMVGQRRPDLQATPDLRAAVDEVAPDAAGGEGRVGRDFGRLARALTGQPLVYRSVVYNSDTGLRLAVTAPDATALDAAVAALDRSALPARSALDALAPGEVAPNGVNAVITLTGPRGAR